MEEIKNGGGKGQEQVENGEGKETFNHVYSCRVENGS